MSDFAKLPDLVSERLGGRVLMANDDFFGSKENLLKAANPVFLEHKYTRRGKWMDGWETRRRRTPGHDWCIIRMGLPGIVRGIIVDTSFFRGNAPEDCSIEGCAVDVRGSAQSAIRRLVSAATPWTELVPHSPVRGDAQNSFSVDCPQRITHLRLSIFPDGGVARLRVHGEVLPGAKISRSSSRAIDLAAIANGGHIAAASDEFFGAPLHLLMPGKAKNMGDGWETRRRRGPGFDWVIVKLGVSCTIERIEVDTTHFKGNFPESCSLEASYSESADLSNTRWQELLPQKRLKAHARQIFRPAARLEDAVSHVRFNIYPDGGVSRLRIFGRPAVSATASKGLERLNRVPERQLQRELLDCCGSREWARRMAARRPLTSAEHVYSAADELWQSLGAEHWLEAFHHHPRIGERRAKAKQSAKSRSWSAKEQSGMDRAPAETLAELEQLNRDYEARFGFIFIICASGKTPDQSLQALRQRLENQREAELRIAAEEQRKITRLRLERLLT
jgi:allantoicase